MKNSVQDVRKHILNTAYGIIAEKGFSGVGINEILASSGVPKGSFYYYFGTKEAFGEALLEEYFDTYLGCIDGILGKRDQSAAARLLSYFTYWAASQSSPNSNQKCLAVKLGAEVSDLSGIMRAVLENGTRKVIFRLEKTLEEGLRERSLAFNVEPIQMAEMLYHLWLGACVRQKMTNDPAYLESTLLMTKNVLSINS